MSKTETPVPVIRVARTAPTPVALQTAWRPFENLRREVDRLFEDFSVTPFRLRRPAFDIEPFWQPASWIAAPAMDFVERDNGFELTAEMPGLEEKNVEVKVSNGILTVRGFREESKDEKKEDYYLKERRYGSFERSLRVPETVDQEKIEATIKNGILWVMLPKKPEAQTTVKKVEVKVA